MVVMMVPSAVGSAAASSMGVIGGNRQPPGSRELMPTLIIGAHRPAVPDVRANGLSSAAMPWEDSARNEMAAHTALKPDVTLDVVYTQSPCCMRFGSSDYDQYPRGGVLQLAIPRRSLGRAHSIYILVHRHSGGHTCSDAHGC